MYMKPLCNVYYIYEATKTTEMGLNVWIHELAIRFLKSVVNNIVVRLKAKEIYDHITQKTINPFQLVLTGLHVSKGDVA